MVPPVTESEWQRYFALYQQSPQYQLINKGMSLADFKEIFFWEYIHRLVGRLIGVVFGLPLIWLVWKKKLSQQWKKHLGMIFFLGGCQGVLGWYMVKSGLIAEPRVSPYRLAAHLSLALLILIYLVCLIAENSRRFRSFRLATSSQPLFRGALLMTILLVMQVAVGAFMAGLKAGLLYNTFPTMNGYWVPPGLWQLQPLYLNFFENPVTVQFIHRILGGLIFLATVTLALYLRKTPVLSWLGYLLLLMTVSQVGLGVYTLLSPGNLYLASLHQALGTILLVFSALLTYSLWKKKEIERILPYGRQI